MIDRAVATHVAHNNVNIVGAGAGTALGECKLFVLQAAIGTLYLERRLFGAFFWRHFQK